MTAIVRLRSVDDDRFVDVVEGRPVSVGREPPGGGVAIGVDDATVSAVAMTVSSDPMGVTIRNTSRFAEIEVLGSTGLRLLFPGEALHLADSATVVVPGRARMYGVQVVCEGAVAAPSRAVGTQPLLGHEWSAADERRDALIALCAARFRPDRFGVDLLNAKEIAQLLSDRGRHATAKAVNNKLQRLREQLAERHGVYLESREDLADFAVRRGLVTSGDVDQLLRAD